MCSSTSQEYINEDSKNRWINDELPLQTSSQDTYREGLQLSNDLTRIAQQYPSQTKSTDQNQKPLFKLDNI